MNCKFFKNSIYLVLLLFIGFGISSCSKDDTKLPPIGGYNSADEVGASNLIAYWNFNSDNNETISKTAASKATNATTVAGIKGNGVQFNAGFLEYPSITALASSLTSFTVSSWVKVTNNGSASSVIFTLTRPNEWAGNINMLAETGWASANSDSVVFKGLIVSNNAFGWQDSRNTTKVTAEEAADGNNAAANKVGGQWAQMVITFDAATRNFQVYSNGTKISNVKWETRGVATSPQIEFTTPTHPVIGALGTTVAGSPAGDWDKALTGEVDELRVFNKALSGSDISALYQLEKAGR